MVQVDLFIYSFEEFVYGSPHEHNLVGRM
jgi:hypothetical protein